MSLINLKKQFDEIAEARGKQKQTVIAKYKNDELFLKTLNFVYNPLITTGLAKKKIEKEVLGFPNDIANSIEDVFDYLKTNNTGSDADILYVQFFIKKHPEEVHEFLKNVFTKDLQIGASERTINEALGYEFIPVHEVMRGKRYEDYEHKVKGKFFITLKMDDYRCTIIWSEAEGRWQFKSRQGQLFEDLVELEPIFNNLPKHLVYDGGLLATDDTLESKDRFRLTGKILRTKGPKKDIMFYIYDMLPLDEFKKGKSKLGYEDRQKEIDKLFAECNLDNNPLIERVPRFYEGEDKSVIFPLLKEVLAKKHEGLMLNTANGKYETKRSDQLLKIKEFHTVDLRIIDYKEHKHGNKLGAFIVDYKGTPVSVGFGYTDEERIELWKKRDEMIGKIIEVKYFQESKNEQGRPSIRHGGFERVRWDKTEVSYD